MPTTCPFGYSGTKKKKKHLTNLEIHSWSKNTKKKNTPPFCHKRTKGKQSNREKPLVFKKIHKVSEKKKLFSKQQPRTNKRVIKT